MLVSCLSKSEPVIIEDRNNTLPLPGNTLRSLPQKELYNRLGDSFDPGDHDDDRKRPGMAYWPNTGNMMWLLPVFRYLIISKGSSIHIQDTPVLEFLPFMLPVAQYWFGSEQVIELAEKQNEQPIGDPIPLFTENMDGDDAKNKGTQGTQPSSNENKGQSSRTSPGSSQAVEEKAKGDQPPDDEKFLHSQNNCDYVECPGELLNQAIKSRNSERVEYILNLYNNPNERWNDELPLHLAAFLRAAEICSILIRHGANTEELLNQETILSEIISTIRSDSQDVSEWAPVIKVFIEEGAYLKESLFVEELLSTKWDQHHDLRVLALDQYKKKGIDANTLTTTEGWPALQTVVHKNDIVSPFIIKWLLESGFQCDKPYHCKTPLFRFLERTVENIDQEKDTAIYDILQQFIKHGRVNSSDICLLLMKPFDKWPGLRAAAFDNWIEPGIAPKNVFLANSIALNTTCFSDSALTYYWSRISSFEEVSKNHIMTIIQEILNEMHSLAGGFLIEPGSNLSKLAPVVDRLKLFLSFGFNFTSSPESGVHPVALLLQIRWDEYPEIRAQALQQFENENIDIGAIKPQYGSSEENSLLFYIMTNSYRYSLEGFGWLEAHSADFRAQLASHGSEALQTILMNDLPDEALFMRMMDYLCVETLSEGFIESMLNHMQYYWDEDSNLFPTTLYKLMLEKTKEKDINLNRVEVDGYPLIEFMIMNAKEYNIPPNIIWDLLGDRLLPSFIYISELKKKYRYRLNIERGLFDPETDDLKEEYPIIYLACTMNEMLEEINQRLGLQFICLDFLMKNPSIEIENWGEEGVKIVIKKAMKVLLELKRKHGQH